MMLDREQLFKTLKTGDLEAARTELVRYGCIIKTEDLLNETGAHRLQWVRHYENGYYIQMHNGRVCSVTVNGEIYYQNSL